MFATVDRARPTRAAIVLLRQPELVDQLPEGERLFDRVQVFALEVLDEGKLELVAIGDLADDDRDPLEPGELRGAEPPLPGHDLIAVEGLASRGSAGGRRGR